MRSHMRIDAENAARSELQLRAALAHLNEALRERRYLAGPEGFSRVDLTACALLAPWCLPNAAYARDLPKAVVAFRTEHEADPLHTGEFVCLIGHSSCGKTTVLSMLAGLTEVTSGVMVLAGKEIKRPGPDRGMVFQYPCPLPWLGLRKRDARGGSGLLQGQPDRAA